MKVLAHSENPVNKNLLLKEIVARLNENLAVLERAARASHVEATHESSRSDSKYDTRGLEAAYLAGGQARFGCGHGINTRQGIDKSGHRADTPRHATFMIWLVYCHTQRL